MNIILTDAIKRGASDIHIEPYEKDYRVRYRIDGVLYEMMNPPLQACARRSPSRCKILAKLDIAEKRLPQDGRIKIKTKIAGQDQGPRLPRLGAADDLRREDRHAAARQGQSDARHDAARLRARVAAPASSSAILKPYGMVLVTGPTGSGKTNTLYSALSRINTPEVNIITAEDPVEFNLPGINQVQMKEQIGLNFAAALRSFLRQDPNIILVGEIRDFETAEVAIKAAMTGHLVLSTLHTNDAPSSINRLMNMGIEPFLVATSVHLIVAQRLVRRICSDCKEPIDVPPAALVNVGFSEQRSAHPQALHAAAAASVARRPATRGASALYEVMEIDDEIRELILSGASAYELRQKALAERHDRACAAPACRRSATASPRSTKWCASRWCKGIRPASPTARRRRPSSGSPSAPSRKAGPTAG